MHEPQLQITKLYVYTELSPTYYATPTASLVKILYVIGSQCQVSRLKKLFMLPKVTRGSSGLSILKNRLRM